MSDKKLWDQYVALEKERDAMSAEVKRLSAELEFAKAEVARLHDDIHEMADKYEIPDTAEAWESGALGRDASFVAASTDDESLINEAAGLRPISIRLEQSLIEDFKALGTLNGLGYQTLMRQVLKRFVDCEKKRVLAEAAASVAMRRQDGRETPPQRKVA
jgi:predicted DNA binding CopG/RHH family protein